jgi:hypothetical protein
VIGATSRLLIVHSPLPAAEARAILVGLLAGDAERPARRSAAGIARIEGAVDASRVTFTALPREGAPLEFDGAIGDTPDGSALVGSISAPMALGWPAAIITALVALFLAWNGIPILLVAVAAVAWIFLSVVVVNSLEEQRLARADVIARWLEDALAGVGPIVDA